jgi:CRISPR-associated protein Cas4
VYDNFHKKTYHRVPQVAGTIAHESIENNTYSSSKRYIMNMEVYSDTLGICGKIDVYDTETKILIERKKKLHKLYDGQKYQLYAQMACMKEMGHEVFGLKIHSLSDNKRHDIPLPNDNEWKIFVNIIEKMQNFSAEDAKILVNSPKCAQCIYQPLCHPL